MNIFLLLTFAVFPIESKKRTYIYMHACSRIVYVSHFTDVDHTGEFGRFGHILWT